MYVSVCVSCLCECDSVYVSVRVCDYVCELCVCESVTVCECELCV